MNQDVDVSNQSEVPANLAAVAKRQRKASLEFAAFVAIALAAFALSLLLDLPPWVRVVAMAALFLILVLPAMVWMFAGSKPPVLSTRARAGFIGLVGGLIGLSAGDPGAGDRLAAALSMGIPVVAMLATSWYVTPARRSFSAVRGFLTASLAVLLVAALCAIFMASSVFWLLPTVVLTLVLLGEKFRDLGIELKTGTSG